MSKIKNAFQNGKAFIAFLTAGDPSADKTVEYILDMEEAGADLVEIGIPFSDPTAEGVVIQEANIRALKAGMTTDGVFDIVRRVREKSQIPLVFLTYLPFEEKGELAPIAASNGVDLISMISPTSEERIRKIAEDAAGFIYIVSSMGVTGVRSQITTDLSSIVNMVRKVTKIPCAVGFGISTPEQAEKMAAVSDGAIVGSAIVKIIAANGANAGEALKEYVRGMKEGVRAAD